MPVELLQQIAESTLPLTLTSESAIDKLRVLVAADMVQAELPIPGFTGSAVVRTVTAYGRATLKARSKDLLVHCPAGQKAGLNDLPEQTVPSIETD